MKAPNLSSIELREWPDGLEDFFMVCCGEDSSTQNLVDHLKARLKHEKVKPHRIQFVWLNGDAELTAYYVEN